VFPNRLMFRVLGALLLFTLAACQPGRQQDAVPAWAQGLEPQARNGARIYFTGTSERGTPIRYTGGPNQRGGGMMGGGMMGGAMMGGYGQWLTCASCHGPEGRGGLHTMHMWVMTAPDIRHAALRAMPELKGRQRPYDMDDFRQTLEQGRHPDGEEVMEDMPRWRRAKELVPWRRLSRFPSRDSNPARCAPWHGAASRSSS